MRKLTTKQQRFVEEYLVDLNATRAAVEAGYSEKTARQQGSRLLTNQKVIKEIESLINERSKRTKIKADMVLKTLMNIAEDKDNTTKERLEACKLINQHLGFPQELNETKIDYIIKQQKRRHQKEQEFSLTKEEWKKTLKHFNNSCAYCGRHQDELKHKLEQEHFIPLDKGGEYTINNIIPACKSCNISKKNNDFFKWYKKRDFYSKSRKNKIIDYLGYENRKQQLSLVK